MVRFSALTLLVAALLWPCGTAALADEGISNAAAARTTLQWEYMVRITSYGAGQTPKQWDVAMSDTCEGSLDSVRFRGQAFAEDPLLLEQITSYPVFVRIQPPGMLETHTISYGTTQAGGELANSPKEVSHRLEDGRTIITRTASGEAHYARLMAGAQHLTLAELDFYLYFEGVDELSIEVWRRPKSPGETSELLAMPALSVEEWLKRTTVAPAFDPADPGWTHLASYRGAYVAEDLQWLRPDGSSTSAEEEVAGGVE